MSKQIINNTALPGKAWDRLELMNSFYHNAICHVCKEFTPSLKRCGGCKLYAYCSKQHQEIHWMDHKQFCKIVNKLLSSGDKRRHHVFDVSRVADITDGEWRNMQLDLKLLWENLLNRKLTNIENQLWMFPRVCAICRNFNQDILFECRTCYSISYCCEEHQLFHFDQHKKYCEALRICLKINIHLFHNASLPHIQQNINSLNKLPNTIEAFTENYAIIEQFQYSNILAGDIISPILTLIYALEVTDLIKNRYYVKSSCVIHLIGASLYEQNFPWNLFCEFFFNWVKNLKNLMVILIGPELISFPQDTNEKSLDSDCFSKNFDLRIERQFYHDYVDCNSFIIPDLIAAFNCGLHEYQSTKNDTWFKSLEYLCMYEAVPLVLTSYTKEEAKMDIKRLLHLTKFNVIINCQKNKFKSPRPLQNWESNKEPIFYQNNYISVLQAT